MSKLLVVILCVAGVACGSAPANEGLTPEGYNKYNTCFVLDRQIEELNQQLSATSDAQQMYFEHLPRKARRAAYLDVIASKEALRTKYECGRKTKKPVTKR